MLKESKQRSLSVLINMSDHFIAPPSSNIFILDFACTTMFELLVGLSNLMFATENRKSRATTFPRIELCVRARCCYGLLCCHFPSSRSLKNLRFYSDMSELIISINSRLFDCNKTLGISWGTFMSEYKVRWISTKWVLHCIQNLYNYRIQGYVF